MSSRSLVFGVLVAVGAGLALLFALRQGDEPKPARAPGPGPAAAAPVGAGDRAPAPVASPGPARTRPSPLRMAKPEPLETTGPDEAPLWTTYDDEARDPSWASAKEQAIRKRLGALLTEANSARPGSVQVPQLECREVHCRMLVTGDNKRAFNAFVESLQDERGFYGDASLLALDGYSEGVDKRSGEPALQVRIHLKYDR